MFGVVGQQCCVRFHGALQRRAFSPVQKTFLLFCRSDQWRIPSCLSVLQCSVAVYPSCMSDRMFLGYKPFSRWPRRQRRTHDSQIQRFLVFKMFNKFVASWLVFFQVQIDLEMIRGLNLNATPLRILVLYPRYQLNLTLHIALCFCRTSDDHFFTLAGHVSCPSKQFAHSLFFWHSLYRPPLQDGNSH